MFSAARYKRMYRRFMGPLSQPITLSVGGTDYPNIPAHVSSYEERDLVEGGPIQVGDLKLIILAESLPAGLRELDQRDLAVIDGRYYGVMNWDIHTRSVGGVTIAVEARVRG